MIPPVGNHLLCCMRLANAMEADVLPSSDPRISHYLMKLQPAFSHVPRVGKDFFGLSTLGVNDPLHRLDGFRGQINDLLKSRLGILAPKRRRPPVRVEVVDMERQRRVNS